MKQADRPIIGRLHILTDFHFQQRLSHADIARFAIEGGADTIQFRQKTGNVRHILREAGRVATICRESQVLFLINDGLSIAQTVGAGGVHLGLDDFPIVDARAILGPDRVIGATATTLNQALRAQDLGADYIGFGPVFSTRSKSNPASVKGISGLTEVCCRLTIPVLAIAGITPERVRPVLEAGAHGVAIMTAVTVSEDPRAVTASIREEIEKYAP